MSTHHNHVTAPAVDPALVAAVYTDSGSVGCSKKVYEVVYVHDHETLKVGELVKMDRTPGNRNALVRLSDWTIHSVEDSCGQYVHLRELDLSVPCIGTLNTQAK